LPSLSAVSPDYGCGANKRILRTTDDSEQHIQGHHREDRRGLFLKTTGDSHIDTISQQILPQIIGFAGGHPSARLPMYAGAAIVHTPGDLNAARAKSSGRRVYG
jgi:hypothetical protein